MGTAALPSTLGPARADDVFLFTLPLSDIPTLLVKQADYLAYGG